MHEINQLSNLSIILNARKKFIDLQFNVALKKLIEIKRQINANIMLNWQI
jgi:hypothetical protein